MKCLFYLLFLVFSCVVTGANGQTYVGSTPAHAVIRNFLGISATDSIDFIRWKLETGSGSFKLSAEYGLCEPSTPGFSNGQRVAFQGELTQSQNYYQLKHKGKIQSMVVVNANIVHFMDHNNHMLSGNGGWSYSLNNIHPVQTNAFSIRSAQTATRSPLVFEGRTPCQELSGLLGLNKGDACNKMKWYLLLNSDSLSHKPSYFLMGGMGYRKETMARGNWEIVTEQNGRIVYRLHFDKWSRPLNLLKGDDNVLFFIDGKGRLLTGNEDFSYTLSRRKEEYPRIPK